MAYVGVFVYSELSPIDLVSQTTAHFGAFVFGSDIDGRQMRGKGELDHRYLEQVSSSYLTPCIP